ncbi:MAG: hypothetical protein WAP35_01325 [Solirubrobacterales bacterium]
MTGSKRYMPPAPQETPFRGDPGDPVPFITDRQLGELPIDPEPLPYQLPPEGATAGEIPWGAGATRPQQPVPGDAPVFQRPAAGPLTAASTSNDQRSARIAVGVGIASIFVMNLILGPIAIVLGARAAKRGERKLGTLAISTGAAGTVIGIVVLILWLAGVLPSLDEMLNE